MKKIALLAFALTSLVSCKTSTITTYYQVYDVSSEDTPLKNGYMQYENSDCAIIYDTWGECGDMSFLVTNKTEQSLYLDMSSSFLVVNGIAYDYFKDRVFTDVYSSYDYLATPSYERFRSFYDRYNLWSTGDISLPITKYGNIQTKEQQVISIPPKASKIIKGFHINKYTHYDCENYVQNFPDNTSETINYTKSTTPLKFRNRIVYSLDKNLSTNKSIENNFWISAMTNYNEKAAISRIPVEECAGLDKDSENLVWNGKEWVDPNGKKKQIKTITTFNMSKPNRFYVSYPEK